MTTTTIEHHPRRNLSSLPAAFLAFGVFAMIAIVGASALRSSDAPSRNAEVPAAPAAYVASTADLFEQRVAGRVAVPAAYVASTADLFEQRVAGRVVVPAGYVASEADLFEQRVAD